MYSTCFFRSKMNIAEQNHFGARPEKMDWLEIPVNPYESQNILRMLVKTPESALLVPNELSWLKKQIQDTFNSQRLYSVNLALEASFSSF